MVRRDRQELCFGSFGGGSFDVVEQYRSPLRWRRRTLVVTREQATFDHFTVFAQSNSWIRDFDVAAELMQGEQLSGTW